MKLLISSLASVHTLVSLKELHESNFAFHNIAIAVLDHIPVSSPSSACKVKKVSIN